MELKDATNINLLFNYIKDKQNFLNYYEEKIVRDLYIYYQEYQLFLLITNKGNNKDTYIEFIDNNNNKIKIAISKNNFTSCGLSWFFKNAIFEDNHYIILKDYQVAYANHEKDFWINKEHEIVSWYLNEEIPRKWIAFYNDIWNPFPINLNPHYEYNLLYEDESIKLVNFISKLVLEEKTLKKISLIHQGYFGKAERPCDIYRTSLRSVDYKYMNYSESIDSIGFNEFYRLQNYYKKQHAELKRNLRLK